MNKQIGMTTFHWISLISLAAVLIYTLVFLSNAAEVAKKNNAKISADNFVSAVHNEITTKMILGEPYAGTFTYDQKKDLSFPFIMRGTTPAVFNITINNQGDITYGTLTLDNYNFIIVQNAVYFEDQIDKKV